MKIVEGKKLSPSGATQIPLLHRPRGPSLPSKNSSLASGGGGQDRGHLLPGEQDCEDADPSPHQAGHGGCGPLVSRLPLVPLAVTLRRLLLAAS